MKILNEVPEIKFMNKRFYAFAFSLIIILGGVMIFFLKGFNLGVDFTGGTMVEVSFAEEKSTEELRKMLGKSNVSQFSIQRVKESGNKFFIKTSHANAEKTTDETKAAEEVTQLELISEQIKDALLTPEERELSQSKKDLNNSSEKSINDHLIQKGISPEDAAEAADKIIHLTKSEIGLIKDFAEIEALELKKRIVQILKDDFYIGSFTFPYSEIVGAQVGHDLRSKATMAAIWVLLGMLAYIGFRFKFIYGFAAVITLLHDVLVTLSFLLFFQIEISISVVAAILTVIGYSLNDTIVIFDRVRDNMKIMRRDSLELILDNSINQTLSRTIITSATTFVAALSLLIFGGQVIYSFSFTMVVGVVFGSYSTIFQSCAWLKIWENQFLKRKK
jgi:preprotein translocase subunit SecF